MQSNNQKHDTQKSLGHPLDQVVDVTATKVVMVKDGTIEYVRHASLLQVTLASTILVGLVQAAHGVRLDDEGWPQELETGEEGPGSTILSLFLAYTKAKAEGSEALRKFCDAFHKAHKKYLRRSVHSVDQWSYYTSSVDAGRIKQQGNSSLTTTFLDPNAPGREVEKFNIDWARDINDIFPSELLPDSWCNVLRGLGAGASGVTAPMAFVGAMMHLFHVHFEATGVAAANARVLCGEPRPSIPQIIRTPPNVKYIQLLHMIAPQRGEKSCMKIVVRCLKEQFKNCLGPDHGRICSSET